MQAVSGSTLTEGSNKLLALLRKDVQLPMGNIEKTPPALAMEQCSGATFQVVNYARLHPTFKLGYSGLIEMTLQSDAPKITFQAAHFKNPESVVILPLRQEQSGAGHEFKVLAFIKRRNLSEKIICAAKVYSNSEQVHTETDRWDYRIVEQPGMPKNTIKLSQEDISQNIASVYTMKGGNYLCIIKATPVNRNDVTRNKVYFRDIEGTWHEYKQLPSKKDLESEYYFEDGSKFIQKGYDSPTPCFVFPDSDEEYPVHEEDLLENEDDINYDEPLHKRIGIEIVGNGNGKPQNKGCVIS